MAYLISMLHSCTLALYLTEDGILFGKLGVRPLLAVLNKWTVMCWCLIGSSPPSAWCVPLICSFA